MEARAAFLSFCFGHDVQAKNGNEGAKSLTMWRHVLLITCVKLQYPHISVPIATLYPIVIRNTRMGWKGR
jgi:hypothetical protein